MRASVLAAAVLAACGRDRLVPIGPGEPAAPPASTPAPPAPPPPPTALLRVTVEGPGSIEATGLSLDCSAGCYASVLVGAAVKLLARPLPGAQFDGWSGACAGTSACDWTAQADGGVVARFSRRGDACAGIMPAAMGKPSSATLASQGARRYCAGATSDGAGNVAHQTYGMGPASWDVYAPDGTWKGQLWGPYEIATLEAGFQGAQSEIVNQGYLLGTWSGDARLQTTAAIDPAAGTSWTFQAQRGGAIVVSTDSWGCPNGNAGHAKLVVSRFTAAGALRSKVDIGGVGCPSFTWSSGGVAAIADDQDRTLVVTWTSAVSALGFPPESALGRWIDADGTPLTGWTALPDGASGPWPRIGGGAFLRTAKGTIALPSGSMAIESSPIELKPQHALVVVRGGKAYAAMPTDGYQPGSSIELFTPSGESCGKLDFPQAVQLDVGRDGTVIALGAGFCTATWWPGLLR